MPLPHSRDLIIGIDGGGTKTVAWLASTPDNWQEALPVVLGRGAAGPANQRAVGPAIARSNLDAAIEAAFLDAGLPRMTVAAACLGLAGADRDDGICWACLLKICQQFPRLSYLPFLKALIFLGGSCH